jgi:dynein assembly factor 3
MSTSADGAASAVPSADGGEDAEVNVLLMGAGDIRHILRTVAVLRRTGSTRPIHFHVAERGMDLIARQLLQISLAYTPSHRLGLQLKAEMFLELLGNSLVRSQTSEYLVVAANRLIDLVTDPELMEQHFPLVSLKQLKFQEVRGRSDCGRVCRAWARPKNSSVDIRIHIADDAYTLLKRVWGYVPQTEHCML